MKKICFKCLKKKDVSMFYAHKAMKDGYLGKCKQCQKDCTAAARARDPEYYKAYDRERASLPHRVKLRARIAREWRKDPEKKARQLEFNRKWREKNVDKYAAHIAISNAVRDGRIKKKPCKCGSLDVEAHHDDYTEPLKVKWLCSKHHAEHHKKERENARR